MVRAIITFQKVSPPEVALAIWRYRNCCLRFGDWSCCFTTWESGQLKSKDENWNRRIRKVKNWKTKIGEKLKTSIQILRIANGFRWKTSMIEALGKVSNFAWVNQLELSNLTNRSDWKLSNGKRSFNRAFNRRLLYETNHMIKPIIWSLNKSGLFVVVCRFAGLFTAL